MLVRAVELINARLEKTQRCIDTVFRLCYCFCSSYAFFLFYFSTLLGISRAQPSYNLSGDYGMSPNPDATWSYGWSTEVGSTFNL